MSAAPAKSNPLLVAASLVVGMFTRNIGAKIAALVLAVVVWFTVRQDITETITVKAQVIVRANELRLEGLMVVGSYEPTVEVTFAGPGSRIREIQKETHQILLQVRRSDMVDQVRRTLEFSLAKRNVKHFHGDDIELREMKDPDVIRLVVALKETRTLPVRRPAVEGDLQEWALDRLEFTPEAAVTGPKDRIDALDGVATRPIQIGNRLEENGGLDRVTLEGPLDLGDALQREQIQLPGGRLTYRAEFFRSRVSEAIELPFVVRYESLDSKVRLEIVPNPIIRRTGDGGQTIKLTFTGAQADLALVRAGAEEGSIRAYVRAEDNEDYKNGAEAGGGTIWPVRLEMPDVLLRRVTFGQPDRASLECSTVPR